MVACQLIHVNISNDGQLRTQCWQGKYKILEVSTHPPKKELVNVYLGEIKYK